jgi:hypothetical protein
MSELGGTAPALREVALALAEQFGKVFGRKMRTVNGLSIPSQTPVT